MVSHNNAHQARPQAGWTSVPALVLRLSLRYRKTITSTAAPVGGVRRSSEKKPKVALSRLIALCAFRVIAERIISLVLVISKPSTIVGLIRRAPECLFRACYYKSLEIGFGTKPQLNNVKVSAKLLEKCVALRPHINEKSRALRCHTGKAKEAVSGLQKYSKGGLGW